MKTRAFLLNIDYIPTSGAALRLTLKRESDGKVFRVFERNFEPYFYLLPKKDNADIDKESIERIEKQLLAISEFYRETNASPTRIEHVKRKHCKDKVDVLKVFCKHPGHVPLIASQAKAYGKVFEHQIPFVTRYLLEKNLRPFGLVEVKCTGTSLESIELVQSDAVPELRVMAFDIETYNRGGAMSDPKKDPCLMISYATNDKSGVLSHTKKFSEKFVEVLKSEKEMIERFCEIVRENHVDLLSSYNGDVFDLPYLRERAKILRADFRLGRDKSLPKTKPKGIRSATSLGGRIHFDAYPVVSFLNFIGAFKLERLTLQEAYAAISGKQKADIKKMDIYKIWDQGTTKELDYLAYYNRDDSIACLFITNYALPLEMELARLTGNLLFDVSRSSAMPLVEPFIMRKSLQRGELIPSKPAYSEMSSRDQTPVEGAFVKLPDPGVYEKIAVLDFRSLYPSIIISHNVGVDSFNCDCCEKNAHVSPQGHRFCQKYKSIIADTLEEVLDTRFAVQKKMKTFKDKESSEYKRLYAKQWSLKILANSVYGLTLNARFRWYSREGGESTTAWARQYIQDTMKQAEEQEFKVLYGDSVTRDRFVTVLQNGFIKIKNIEELFDEYAHTLKKYGEKEIVFPQGVNALSLDPVTLKPVWRQVNEVIRHKTNKPILRVEQKYGETVVTTDHSLMTLENGKLREVKPTDLHSSKLVRVDSVPEVKEINKIDVLEVLNGYVHKFNYKNAEKTARIWADDKRVWFGWMKNSDEIYVKRFIELNSPEGEALCSLLGAYIAEGSSSTIETTASRFGASIASSDVQWLRELQQDYSLLFNAKTSIIASNVKTRHLNYATTSGSKTVVYDDLTHKLQMMNGLSAVFFKCFCGQKSKGKKMPDFIFHAPISLQHILLNRMIQGDGSHYVNKKLGYSEVYVEKNFSYTTNSLQLISGLSLLLNQISQNYVINYRPSKAVYSLRTCDRFNSNLTTKLTPEKYAGYVYDLNVEGTHTFVDSCGQILLHNTDSMMLLYKNENDVMEFRDKINKSLPERMELELEDFYPRGVFVAKKGGDKGAKKKYALINKEGKIKIRGFELVRRDWSKVARRVQRQVLEILLKDGDVNKALALVRKTVAELQSGKVPLDDLVIVTQLRKKPKDYEIMSPEVSAYVKAIKAGLQVPEAVVSYVVTSKGKTISEKAQVRELAKDYDADYYINHQLLPSVLKILSELGVKEDDVLTNSKQSTLGGW
ncbi:MAG: DNA polymerase domain-containing protein [Candidatus Micrarchaeota archaeon]